MRETMKKELFCAAAVGISCSFLIYNLYTIRT